MENNIFGPLGNEKYTEYVRDIRASAFHLLDLVGDILDTSAIESGEFSLPRSSLKVDEVMRECMKLMRVQALNAGVELAANFRAGLPLLHADRLAIKQIAINLLANAVKFTPEGGRIDIDLSATGNTFLISVADTGSGIPEDVLPDILLPFDRGRQNPHESKEGTGLGLAIVNSLVALHDGKIEIESVVGAGTTVRVWLPLDGSGAA